MVAHRQYVFQRLLGLRGMRYIISKEDNKLIIESKPQVSWTEFFKTFKGDPSFDVNRGVLKDKGNCMDFY